MALQYDQQSMSYVVEARWFLPGDAGADLLHGVDDYKKRVDRYHLDSLSASTSLKRRGRHGRFEEKWRIGEPSEFTVGDVTGQAETWRKQPLAKCPDPAGRWIEVHKRIWAGRDWEISRLDVGAHRSWTVALSHPWEWHQDGAAVLAPWWPQLRDHGFAASYPVWLQTLSEELADLTHRAAG